MDRRKFIELMGLSLAGAALPGTEPFGWAGGGHGSPGGALMPLMLCFEASGGWDPTLHCDPHAHSDYSYYGESDIRETASGLLYAPQRQPTWPDDQNASDIEDDYSVGVTGSRVAFFEKYQNDLLVINGIDNQTVSHDVGRRNTWSGTTREGHPCVAALHASVAGMLQPMPFLTSGGFDATANLLVATRAGDPELLFSLVEPYKASIGPSSGEELLPVSIQEAIALKQQARYERLSVGSRLPRRAEVMARFNNLRMNEGSLAVLSTKLDELAALPIASPGDSPLVEKVELAVAGMMAGITTSANVFIGGFDTHQDHWDYEDGQRLLLKNYFEAVDYAAELLKAVGLFDRTLFMMGSDFGRTIRNNDEEMGKDHWQVSSMMLMGHGVSGGRTVGQTFVEAGLKGVSASKLNPQTLQPDDNGIYISPAHIHLAIREKLGILESPNSQQFSFGDDIELLENLL